MHVLLVEPDVLLAKTYQLALEAAGHSVASVRSAQDAVHEADVQTPDAVVLELQMPKHNGIEFLYEFRSYPEWLHVPIVVQSHLAPHQYHCGETLCRELGVKRLLHKPATNLRQLVATVASVSQAAR
jgi:DNA-binding response OmpR family regulator